MLFTKKSFTDFPWKLLIVEAFLVVLSVLLALALNSWREARTHQDLAKRALQEVVDEVQTNCPRIQGVQSYHKAVANGEQKPGGLKIGFLRNDAWDVAKTTGAVSYLEYEIAAKIGEINAHQSDHRSIVQAYLGAVFTHTLQFEQLKKIHQEGERGVINELVRIEKQLLAEYESLQKLVNEHYDNTINTNKLCKKE